MSVQPGDAKLVADLMPASPTKHPKKKALPRRTRLSHFEVGIPRDSPQLLFLITLEPIDILLPQSPIHHGTHVSPPIGHLQMLTDVGSC